MSPVDPTKIENVIANASKRFGGAQTIRRGNKTPPIKRISWGNPAVNQITMGGAPMGRMIRPWGAKSSCKSLMQWMLVKECLDYRDDEFPDGLTVVYYDVEGTYDENVPLKLGIDTGRILVVQEHVGIIEELGFQITEGLLETAHVHIIDTCAHGLARQEFDSPADKHSPRGARARAWGEVIRKMEEKKGPDNLIVLMDQVRRNQQFNTEMSAGSEIFNHASSMDLHHRTIKKLYLQADGTLGETFPRTSNDPNAFGKEVVVDGMIIGIEINKSKVCRPFGKAKLTMDFSTLKFDQIEQLFDVGIHLGVIEKNGSFFKVPGAKSAIQGQAKLMDYMSSDPSLAMAVIEAQSEYFRKARLNEHG